MTGPGSTVVPTMLLIPLTRAVISNFCGLYPSDWSHDRRPGLPSFQIHSHRHHYEPLDDGVLAGAGSIACRADFQAAVRSSIKHLLRSFYFINL